jgi:hypothetical protein
MGYVQAKIELSNPRQPKLHPLEAGLIQSVSQALWPGLPAWVEVGGIAPLLCPKPLFPQSIST